MTIGGGGGGTWALFLKLCYTSEKLDYAVYIHVTYILPVGGDRKYSNSRSLHAIQLLSLPCSVYCFLSGWLRAKFICSTRIFTQNRFFRSKNFYEWKRHIRNQNSKYSISLIKLHFHNLGLPSEIRASKWLTLIFIVLLEPSMHISIMILLLWLWRTYSRYYDIDMVAISCPWTITIFTLPSIPIVHKQALNI